MMNRFILYVVLALGSVLGIHAQGRQGIVLPWGKAESQLGLYQDGDYLRGPAFFSVDMDGNFYVADAYKARVAVFGPSGRFLKAVPIPAISPRTAFSKRTEDGSFVVSNDQELSRWSDQGTQIGSSGLGLVLPSGYFATAQSLIVWIQQGDGEICRIFSRDLTQESLLSLKTAHGSVAALRDDSGRFWFPRWTEQATFYRWKAPLPPQAQLAEWTKEGISLWVAADAKGTTISWIDAKGDRTGEQLLPMTPTAEKKTCFAFSPGLSLYYAFWDTKGFRVQTLGSHPQ